MKAWVHARLVAHCSAMVKRERDNAAYYRKYTRYYRQHAAAAKTDADRTFWQRRVDELAEGSAKSKADLANLRAALVELEGLREGAAQGTVTPEQRLARKRIT